MGCYLRRQIRGGGPIEAARVLSLATGRNIVPCSRGRNKKGGPGRSIDTCELTCPKSVMVGDVGVLSNSIKLSRCFNYIDPICCVLHP